VPLVGWVFIDRLPVRPSAAKSVKKASREANRPMPIPRTPPPNIKLAAKTKATTASATTASASTQSANARTKPTTAVNELTPFLEFVEKYKIGSKVKGVVETYSAHGVYVRIGNVLGYLPLRLMSNPPPRSAREFVKIGQQVSLVVSSFTASRRSIDVGIVGLVAEVKKSAVTVASAPAAPTKRAKKQKKRAAPVQTRPAAVQARKAPAKKK
jgi:transcriptional accessory protein Tex/SPT6